MNLEEFGPWVWVFWIGVCVIVMWVVELKNNAKIDKEIQAKKEIRNNDTKLQQEDNSTNEL